MKQAANLGIKALFLGGDGWSNEMYEFGGPAIDGKFYCTHWHPGVSFPQSLKLRKSYEMKYHSELQDSYAPMAYDAVMVFADAVRRAIVLDRDKIRDALSLTRGFQGATGTITLDKNGDPVNKNAVILRFQDQTSVFVKVIAPVAAGDESPVPVDADGETAATTALTTREQNNEEKE
jgi:branched-chain amino acid transport system substrate-binding protein